MSKSQIPGICAMLNEKIDALEIAKEQVAFRENKAQSEWDAKLEQLDNERNEIREKLRNIQLTVSTLQALKDGEL